METLAPALDVCAPPEGQFTFQALLVTRVPFWGNPPSATKMPKKSDMLVP
jgi:hypothetical protein